MSDGTTDIERRKFLCVLGAVGAGATLATVPGCGTTPGAPPATPFSAGRVTDHAQDLYRLYSAQKIIVGRDAMGFYAMSIICPHEGYDVGFVSQGGSCTGSSLCTSSSTTGALVCSSGHGGTFSANGVRTAGPPPSNLTHYQVTVGVTDAGTDRVITVNPGVEVAASVRIPA